MPRLSILNWRNSIANSGRVPTPRLSASASRCCRQNPKTRYTLTTPRRMPIKWPLVFLTTVFCVKGDCLVQETFNYVNTLLQNHKYEEASKAVDNLRPCQAISNV